MKNKRRIHNAEFKARVALEAIKGLKTVQQSAAENELHPTQVTQWKSQMMDGAAEVFDQGRGRHSQEQAAQNQGGTTGAQDRTTRRGGRLALKKVQGAGDRSMRKAMVESTHPQLSVRRQCELLAVNRNRIPEAKPSKAPCFSEEQQRMIRRIDELYLEHPDWALDE